MTFKPACAAYSASGDLAALGGPDGAVTLLAAATLSVAAVLRPPGPGALPGGPGRGLECGPVRAMAFSPCGARLGVAGGRTGCDVWVLACRPGGFSDDPSGLKAAACR